MTRQVSPPAISIYIPTHSAADSPSTSANKVRYKNALQGLAEQLTADERSKTIYDQLVSLVDDDDFWSRQTQSVAILADRKGHETVKLSYELTPATQVEDVFALSPLAIMQNMNLSYYLLDINFKQPKLYTGNTYGLQEEHDAQLPGPIDEELNLTVGRQNTVGSRGGAGGSNTIYYGHAEVDSSHERETSRYLRLLATAVDAFLSGASDPLLITGSPKVIAEFKTITSYPHVSSSELTADYSPTREQQLFICAKNEIEAYGRDKRAAAIARYHESDPEHRANGQVAVMTAAEHGRVDTLLLPVLRLTTDSVRDLDTPELLVELPDDFAGFDAAVRRVIDQAGTIIPVERSEFETDPSMKAILRY